jgi:anti-anti-sigma regulatory factor
MLKITHAVTTDDENGGALLRLEGQVTGSWVGELRRVCNEAISHNGRGARPLRLDLTNVLFIDADGVALFRELAARRVSLENGSVFIAEQLKGVANGDD